MAITTLPTPPSRQRPTEFSNEADAFLGALPTFGTEANALQTDVTAKQVTASNAATTATTQADIATTQAGNALTSANNAASSASSALSSANSAAAAFDSFDDRYLGSKATDPALDNDGNTLITGALYFNSALGEMRVWSGSTWVAAYLPTGSYLTNASIGTTVQAYDADLTSWADKTAPVGAAVGTTDTQTLTNKTIEDGTFTNGYTEEVYALTGTVLNPANGSIQTITLSGNTTFTESLSSGQSIILGIDDGTTYTVTWPTITWTTNPVTAPTLPTSGYLWVVLWKVGTTLYGKY